MIALDLRVYTAPGHAVARMLELRREVDARRTGGDIRGRNGNKLIGHIQLRFDSIERFVLNRAARYPQTGRAAWIADRTAHVSCQTQRARVRRARLPRQRQDVRQVAVTDRSVGGQPLVRRGIPIFQAHGGRELRLHGAPVQAAIRHSRT